MAWELETKDGIVIKDIPDSVPQDHPSLVQRVAKIRADRVTAEGGAMALEGASGPQKFLIGAGKSVADLGRGVSQLVGFGDQQAIDEAKARDAALMSSGAGMAGNIAGNVAMTALPGVGIQSTLAKGAAAILPRMVAPTAAAAGTGALISGTTTPIASDESRLKEAGLGAAGGAIGDLGMRGVARAVQPIMQSEPVQKLLASGIVPSMGQAAGGFVKSMESRLSSVPFLGDVIRWGGNRPVKEMNLAVMKTVDPSLTAIGREGVQAAQDVADTAYKTALSKFTVVPDSQFVAKTRAIESDAAHLLTNEQRQQFRDYVKSRIVDPLRMGAPPWAIQTPQMSKPIPVASGEIAKEIDSEIGSKAIGYRSSQSQSEKNLGQAMSKLQVAWRDLIERNAPPGVANEVREANRKWANLTILERAAAKSGSNTGIFTPAQLLQAVRESDPSIRKRVFAAGGARGQELADAAKTTIGAGYPDSGTAGRYLAAEMLLGGTGALVGGATGHGYGEGGAIGAAVPLGLAALASPMYSRAGARYMVGNLIPGQLAASQALRSAAPYGAQLGRASLADLARR